MSSNADLVKGQNMRARKLGAQGTLFLTGWEAVLEANDSACVTCGSVDNISIDHIVPLSQGGANTLYNVQPLCTSCNSRKGNRSSDSQSAALDDFLRRYADDNSEWWRLSPGEHQNLFEALLYRLKIAEGECGKLRDELYSLRTNAEARAASAAALGSIRSERKAATSRANGSAPVKDGSSPRGRPRKQHADALEPAEQAEED